MAMVFAISAIFAPIAFASSPTLTVQNVTTQISQEVDVKVDVSNNPGFAGFQIQLAYDRTRVTPVSISPGIINSSSGTFTSNLTAPGGFPNNGTVQAVFTQMENFTGNGTLFTVRFRPVGSSNFTTTITPTGSFFNQSLQSVNFTYASGTLTVASVKYGDTNRDGSINVADLVLLMQYLAGWTNISIDTEAANVLYDNSVNSADAVKLAQYLAGWSGIILGPTGSGGTTPPIAQGVYLLESENKNFVVDANLSGSAGLRLFTVNNGSAQQIRVTHLSNGNVWLAFEGYGYGNNYTITQTGDSPNGLIAPLGLQPYSAGDPKQQWQIVSVGNDQYKLLNVYSMMCLDVYEAKFLINTKLNLYEDNGSNAQKFTFKLITSASYQSDSEAPVDTDASDELPADETEEVTSEPDPDVSQVPAKPQDTYPSDDWDVATDNTDPEEPEDIIIQ
jgi:hypothetical protein